MHANPVGASPERIPLDGRSELDTYQNTGKISSQALRDIIWLVVPVAVAGALGYAVGAREKRHLIVGTIFRAIMHRIRTYQNNDGRCDLGSADTSRLRDRGPKIIDSSNIRLSMLAVAVGIIGLIVLDFRGRSSFIDRTFRAVATQIHEYQNNNGRRDLLPVSTSRTVKHLDLNVERLDPCVWENACTILGLSPKEGRDEDAIREAHTHSITQLARRNKAVEGPLSAEIGALIQEVEQAYKTLMGSLDKTTRRHRDRDI